MSRGVYGRNNFPPYYGYGQPMSPPVSPFIDRGAAVYYPPTDAAEPAYRIEPRGTAAGIAPGGGTETQMFTSDVYKPGESTAAATEKWNWWTTYWTAAAVLLCPAFFCCTLPALICNIFAYVDHKAGEYTSKHSRLRWSVACSVTAFILGSLTTIILIVLLFTVLDAQNWILPSADEYDYVS